jgi:hypothetical protein
MVVLYTARDCYLIACPCFPKTLETDSDIDMKFLRSTGGEIKKGQIKKSYV